MKHQILVAAIAAAAAGTAQASLFSDSFDSNTSANWTTFTSSADTAVVFAYDYSADGIPSAPNSSGGSTSGVKFTANMTAGAAAGLNIVPNGQNFTGDYRLTFDVWMNINGPFPGGGTGSTEMFSAGVGMVSPALAWHFNAPSQFGWFAVSGEGGSSQDFRLYRGSAQEASASIAYAATGAPNPANADNRNSLHTYYHTAFPGGQQAPASQQSAHAQQTGGLNTGTIGFAWRQVEIEKMGEDITYSIDGLLIGTLNQNTHDVNVEGNISIGYFDQFASLSDNVALSFGLIDNVVVTAVPEPEEYAAIFGGVLVAGALLRRRFQKR